jgi:hypothetical protein
MIVTFTQLDAPALVAKARKLPSTARLKVSAAKLTYLAINDDYIHQLFPLLPEKAIKKPDYFTEDSIGAHISVVYPEENCVPTQYLNQEFSFTTTAVFAAELAGNKYYVLGVEAPELLHVRHIYGLPKKLSLYGHWVDLHITLGKSI